MESEKKPVFWMVLFGVIRHALSVVGTWLVARGLIDADTHERLLSEGTTQVLGYVLMLAPFIWSAAQKWQVWGWVKTALHLDPRSTSPGTVPSQSPGPNMPM